MEKAIAEVKSNRTKAHGDSVNTLMTSRHDIHNVHHLRLVVYHADMFKLNTKVQLST